MTKALQENLAKLEAFLNEEQKSKNPSQVYIEDLKLSIKAAKRQLEFYKDNTNMFIKVEGVKV